MKSGKQRRTELKAKKQARIEKRNNSVIQSITAAWAAERGWIPIDRTALTPHNSHDEPDFVQLGYYFDRPFDCTGCNSPEIWTAVQQKWWYEEAKGNLFSTAKFCRPCRQKEQDRRAEARRIHLEGIAKKEGRRSVGWVEECWRSLSVREASRREGDNPTHPTRKSLQFATDSSQSKPCPSPILPDSLSSKHSEN